MGSSKDRRAREACKARGAGGTLRFGASGPQPVEASWQRASTAEWEYPGEDPQYLAAPCIRTVQFKKQDDAAEWNPTPCPAS